MKKILILIVFVVMEIIAVYSQVPVRFNYQAVVRDNTGELVVNQNIAIRISILEGTVTGDELYSETHSVKTDSYGVVNLKIGTGNDVVGDLLTLDWGSNSKFLQTDVDLSNGTNFTTIGVSEMVSVPYALYANSALNLRGDGVYSTNTDTLFVVKDHSGNVVFAVFPDGAQVIVNETAKGKVGGFAVSGRSPTKAVDREYLRVTTDSTRIYVDKPVVKGKVGGFAVSGRSPTKDILEPFFFATIDSTRIFTKDTISGFGIRDFSSGLSTSYLQLTPLNYFIGHRAGESITSGKYNTFIGYETGLNSTWGNGNLFLGFNAGRGNVDGALNVFIGNGVGYNFTGAEDGEENIFIGNNAGYNCITTANSIFIGTRSGYYCGASYGNTFIGDRTASFGIAGNNNTILGSSAGFRISGSENVFIGAYAGNATTSGYQNTYIGYQAGISSTGKRNVFIGANAGAGETGSNKLYIANNADSSLIIGDFVAQEVFIDGDLTATTVVPSDINLKTNLLQIQSGLKLLTSLTGYYFNWNEIAKDKYNFSLEDQQIGIIAQDVEKVFPQMVVTNSNGYKAVEYAKLSVVIIEAIKEQQNQIAEQKKQVELLVNENKILKEKLDEIMELLKKE